MIDVGQMVGNYNVTAKLGEGGMGMVFLAEHPVIGSKVALKAIHPRFAQNVEVVARFVNEAKLVNQIGHDHIVDITDFGHTGDGDFYFVMEYLQGQTLGTAIREGGPLAPARALTIAVQLADALQASHEHGVIHRDLKPENIFLVVRDSTQDFVKVLDFGLAKLTSRDQAVVTQQTKAGWLMGTPFYMSPEQCEGRREIDGRADIYALGVILFEMLTGFVPFGGRGFGEIILKHMAVPPPSARSIVPDLPPALDAILSRALSKEPARRFQTMVDLRAALVDPEFYASSTAATGVAAQDQVRARARTPRSGSEEILLQTLASPTRLEKPPQGHSTLYGSAGEVTIPEDDVLPEGDLLPRMSRGRVLGLFAAATLTGIAVAILFGGRRPPMLMTTARASSIAVASDRSSATVRVNVNSDPEGATVTLGDGTVLGTTPVAVEVPHSDTRTWFVVHKDGYLPKSTAVVPNVSSAVFTALQKDEPPARLPVVTATATLAPSLDTVRGATDSPSPARAARRSPRLPQPPAPLPPPVEGDGDEVLELSVY